MIDQALRRGIDELSDFVVHAAAATEGLLGFGWEPRTDAPNTYPALKAAFLTSQTTGRPLPISDEHSDRVIYRSPEVNLAFRYWHDTWHVLRGLDFTPPQELRLASIQLRELADAGWDPDTVAWRLLYTDLVGQVYLSAVGKCFPKDQENFVLTGFQYSLEAAILGELGGWAQRGFSLPRLEAA